MSGGSAENSPPNQSTSARPQAEMDETVAELRQQLGAVPEVVAVHGRPPESDIDPNVGASAIATSDWAAAIDLEQCQLGAPIAAGNFGVVHWLIPSSGDESLVMKIPKRQQTLEEFEHEAESTASIACPT